MGSASSHSSPEVFDAAVIGAGHNGLIAAAILTRSGKRVIVIESSRVIGGACRTEYPFRSAPKLGCSTGAYLLGPMPPEVLEAAGLRDRIRILPRRPHGYFLLESGLPVAFGVPDGDAHLSPHDRAALHALDHVLSAIRDDIAPLWLRAPISAHDSIQHVRTSAAPKPLVGTIQDIYRGIALGCSVGDLLSTLRFESALLAATVATDGLVGSARGVQHPGTALNFLAHNMLRLPPGDGAWTDPPLGAWQLVEGGMGAITQALAAVILENQGTLRLSTRAGRPVVEPGSDYATVPLHSGERMFARHVILAIPPAESWAMLNDQPDPKKIEPGPNVHPTASEPHERSRELERGTSLKINMALRRLPKVSGVERLPPALQSINALQGTIHVLPRRNTLERLDAARHTAVHAHTLPDPFDCMIDVYTHTAVDHTLRDDAGRHAMSLFVQWVPPSVSQADAEAFAWKLLRGPVAAILPDITECVEEIMVLSPRAIADHFGLPGGHIHHTDNAHAFRDRGTVTSYPDRVFAASAGGFPAGSVIGSAGYIAASRVLAESQNL